MARINITNNSDGQLSVEADGEAILPSEIFTDVGIRPDTNFWDLRTLEEQYDLGFKNIMAGIEIYADANNADIDYSVEELPSSVAPDGGAMSTYYEGRSIMNITKGRLKQIIQEELSRPQIDEGHDSIEGVFGIQGHEPEEELVTVTADDLRQTDFVELITRSLRSGADAGSLMGEVELVFGEILALFPDEE